MPPKYKAPASKQKPSKAPAKTKPQFSKAPTRPKPTKSNLAQTRTKPRGGGPTLRGAAKAIGDAGRNFALGQRAAGDAMHRGVAKVGSEIKKHQLKPGGPYDSGPVKWPAPFNKK